MKWKYDWVAALTAANPNSTPEQQQGANWLFNMEGDGDQLYHGLNFAAYGGKVNRFDDGGRGRTITIGELPEAYVRKHGNMPVVTPAGKRTTLSDAYKNYNQTTVNTNDVPGLADYLITQDQPDIATAREVELAQQHRANERFNNQVDNAAFAIMSAPLLVPALTNPLTTLAGIGGGLIGQYTEDKMISNLSEGKYNNWHDIVDSWDGVMGNMNNAERLYSSMFDPGMFIGGIAAGYPVSVYEKPIPDVYSAAKTFANKYNSQEVPKGFWKNTIRDLIFPNRSVINAVNEERYPLNSAIFKRTANALHSAATEAHNKSINLIAERLKASPDRNRNTSDHLIDKSAAVAKGRNIFIEPNYQKLYPSTNGIVTYDTGEPVIHYPLFVSENSNIMHNPLQWRLGRETIYHEPVHVAQHDMYPVAFENGNAIVYD